ncbi:MAG TPA: hypothetical protein VKH63_02955, partial [Candidatus Acidoferrum sp.]|nr:hypothetical protein [Candidatus Acidoferrum sp.]
MPIRKDARKIIGSKSAVAALLLCAAIWCPASRAQTPSTTTSPTPVYKEFVDETGRTVRVP